MGRFKPRCPVGIEGPLSPRRFVHLSPYCMCPDKGPLGWFHEFQHSNVQIITWDNGTHAHKAILAQTLPGHPGLALWKFPSWSTAVAAQTFEARLQA